MKILLVYANTYELLNPPPVGFSLRNTDIQKYPDTIDFVPDYVRWVNIANMSTTTIIGGSAVMAMPKALFEHVGATYGIVGQGGKSLPIFLEELETKTSDFNTPCAMWRENGQVHVNNGLFDGYPENGSINWSIIDHKRYRANFGNCCIITKTDCPHKCLFCDAGTSFRSHFVTREPLCIMEDFKRDARDYEFHKRDYFFIDAIFNAPLSWAKSVLETIIKSDLKPLYLGDNRTHQY